MYLEMLAQAEIVKNVASNALASGVFGTVSVGLAVVIWWRERVNGRLIEKLSADKDAVYTARLADKDALLPKLLDMNTSVVVALTNSTRILEAQQEASTGLKDAVKDLAHEIRERKAA